MKEHSLGNCPRNTSLSTILRQLFTAHVCVNTTLINNYCELFTGHVGPPLTCNAIKLVDVPEKECFAKDGRGEVRLSKFQAR